VNFAEELAFLGLRYATVLPRQKLLTARTVFVQRLLVPDIFCRVSAELPQKRGAVSVKRLSGNRLHRFDLL
jgi:hypothetical protein